MNEVPIYLYENKLQATSCSYFLLDILIQMLKVN